MTIVEPTDAGRCDVEHCVVAITSNDGYLIKSRYWQCSEPRALLIMVHGVVSHSQWLESIARSMAQQHICTLAVDRRGAGMNEKKRGDAPNEQVLIDDLESVCQWADTLNIPMHMVGFCWGSNYVVNFLTASKRHVESVIHIAPSLFPSALIRERNFITGESGAATEEPVMPIDQFTDGPQYQTYILPDPLRLKKVSPRLNRCMQRFSASIWMKFLHLKHPCLIVLGTKDAVVDNTATKRVFQRLQVAPKAIHELPAKHGIQFDAPEATCELLMQWLQQFATRPTP